MKEKLFTYQGKMTEVIVPENDQKELFSYIQKARDEDLRFHLLLQSLIHTEKTLSNSLGDIYSYLQDRAVCKACSNNFFHCPKNDRGYRLSLSYNAYLDRIIAEKSPCNLRLKKQDILKYINPCDIGGWNLLYDLQTLLDCFFQGENSAKQKDLYSLMAEPLIQKDAKKNGYVIETINDKDFSHSLLNLVAYRYANQKYSVAFLDTELFFKNLTSKRTDLKNATEEDEIVALHADVLCLDHLDSLPFFSEADINNILIPFLKRRQGKINYASVSSKQAYQKLLNGRSPALIKAKELLFSLFEEKVIRDFDLR